MKKLIFSLIMVVTLVQCKETTTKPDSHLTVVEKYGRLQVDGTSITDKNGDTIVLRGMSLFWSQWGGHYYNAETLRWLRDDWGITIVRAAMGIESGGYLENPSEEKAKVESVIDTAIELGLYVIVDWHDHHAENHQEESMAFFDELSKKYGDVPNLIYEIYNEPLNNVTWSGVVKPYSEAVISAIRANDPDNLIIAGSPTWSQDVDIAAADPIDDVNIAYTLHFYTGTHRQSLRDKANLAMARGAALFVTEWGTSEASGDGNLDYQETETWLKYMDDNNLSWCNWSVIDKDETSAALLPGANFRGGWGQNELSESGTFIRNAIKTRNADLLDSLGVE